MLVLSRKLGEKVVIGDDIVITVVAVQGDKIRLGIEAPRDVPVHRAEIAERLRSADAGAGPALREGTRPVRQARFTGWRVVYSTADPGHPFVREFLREVMRQFPGVRTDAVHSDRANTLEVIPPRGTEIGRSDQVGEAVDTLLKSVYRRMAGET